jgi:hypothetical protein
MSGFHDEHDSSSASEPLLSDLTGERRKGDRRAAGRQGKYDRRRNRCAHCRSFQAGTPPDLSGVCTFHHLPMRPDAFACVEFTPLEHA